MKVPADWSQEARDTGDKIVLGWLVACLWLAAQLIR